MCARAAALPCDELRASGAVTRWLVSGRSGSRWSADFFADFAPLGRRLKQGRRGWPTDPRPRASRFRRLGTLRHPRDAADRPDRASGRRAHDRAGGDGAPYMVLKYRRARGRRPRRPRPYRRRRASTARRSGPPPCRVRDPRARQSAAHPPTAVAARASSTSVRDSSDMSISQPITRGADFYSQFASAARCSAQHTAARPHSRAHRHSPLAPA